MLNHIDIRRPASRKWLARRWVLFLFAVELTGLAMFTRGFLLSRSSVDQYSEHQSPVHDFGMDASTDSKISTPPRFKRVLMLVVDAMRLDFVAPQPYSQSTILWKRCDSSTAYIQGPAAILMSFIADAPTTTMQRVKALLTGSLPTFLDVGSVFAAGAITEDNLFAQAQRQGLQVGVVGDDTWSQLFPGSLNYSSPYPSLNVKDLDTVDNGVYKELTDTLLFNTSWDILVGHYLGVDHAGHTYGVDSPQMAAKLQQMDKQLLEITSSLLHNAAAGGQHEGTLLLVFGDHGQTMSGDHGGGTVEETESPLLAVNLAAAASQLKGRECWPDCLVADHLQSAIPPDTGLPMMPQLDFAATLAAQLGIPIPYESVGKVHPALWGLVPHPESANETCACLSACLRVSWPDFDRPLVDTDAAQQCSSLCSDCDRCIAAYATAVSSNVQQVHDYLLLYARSGPMTRLPQSAIRSAAAHFSSVASQSEPLTHVHAALTYLHHAADVARMQWTQFNMPLIVSGLVVLSTCAGFCILGIVASAHWDSNCFQGMLALNPAIERALELPMAHRSWTIPSGLVAILCVLRAAAPLSNSLVLGELQLTAFLIATGVIVISAGVLSRLKLAWQAVACLQHRLPPLARPAASLLTMGTIAGKATLPAPIQQHIWQLMRSGPESRHAQPCVNTQQHRLNREGGTFGSPNQAPGASHLGHNESTASTLDRRVRVHWRSFWGCVLLIVTYSCCDNSWRAVLVSFILGTRAIYNLYAAIKFRQLTFLTSQALDFSQIGIAFLVIMGCCMAGAYSCFSLARRGGVDRLGANPFDKGGSFSASKASVPSHEPEAWSVILPMLICCAVVSDQIRRAALRLTRLPATVERHGCAVGWWSILGDGIEWVHDRLPAALRFNDDLFEGMLSELNDMDIMLERREASLHEATQGHCPEQTDAQDTANLLLALRTFGRVQGYSERLSWQQLLNILQGDAAPESLESLHRYIMRRQLLLRGKKSNVLRWSYGILLLMVAAVHAMLLQVCLAWLMHTHANHPLPSGTTIAYINFNEFLSIHERMPWGLKVVQVAFNLEIQLSLLIPRMLSINGGLLFRAGLGSANGSVGDVTSRLPGASLFADGAMVIIKAVKFPMEYMFETPLRLLMPQVILVLCLTMAIAVPAVALVACAARRAWQQCFKQLRMTQYVSETEDMITSDVMRLQFHESWMDLMRDFTVDDTGRASAVLELVLWLALGALIPAWLLLLPLRAVAALIYALVLVGSLFGLVKVHYWAEMALHKVRTMIAGGTRGAHAATDSLQAEELAGRGGVTAIDTSLSLMLLFCLLPSMLFLGSSHFCEFAGVHWASAFIGFEDNVTARSFILIGLNTFAPQAIGVILVMLAAARDMTMRLHLIDSAAAEGHQVLTPNRQLGCDRPVRGQPGASLAATTSQEDVHAPDIATIEALQLGAGVPKGRRQHEAAATKVIGEPVMPFPCLQPAWLARLVHKCLLHVWGASGNQYLIDRCSLWGGISPEMSSNMKRSEEFFASQSPMNWNACVGMHALFSTALFIRLAVSTLDILFASTSALIQRRHLMIWAVFAPKWMFEACFWFVSCASLAVLTPLVDIIVLQLLPRLSPYDYLP